MPSSAAASATAEAGLELKEPSTVAPAEYNTALSTPSRTRVPDAVSDRLFPLLRHRGSCVSVKPRN